MKAISSYCFVTALIFEVVNSVLCWLSYKLCLTGISFGILSFFTSCTEKLNVVMLYRVLNKNSLTMPVPGRGLDWVIILFYLKNK